MDIDLHQVKSIKLLKIGTAGQAFYRDLIIRFKDEELHLNLFADDVKNLLIKKTNGR